MRLVFIGTGEIGLPVLRWLLHSAEHDLVGLVTQPDRPAGRSQQLLPPPIKAALGSSILPIFQPRRIKQEEAVAEIRRLAPEIIVVMAYGQILPRALLEIPAIACLNLHASLLPRHRGAAPIQAAITAGDRETGITVIYMDEGVDSGDILLQKRIPISADDTGGSLHGRLAELAPVALKDALTQIVSGTASREVQNSAEATYAPKLEREHGRIDLREPVDLIERKLRAFVPWPGSYIVLRKESGEERKLKIFGATIADRTRPEPGTIATSESEIMVSASDGWLQLREVQLDGKKRMSAAELARGHPWLQRSVIVAST